MPKLLSLDFATCRLETIDELMKILKEKKYILIKSPPLSGKSCLSKILEVYASNFHGIRVLKVLPFPNDTYDSLRENFNSYYKAQNITWSTAFNPLEPTIIVFDETQILYEMNELWNYLKQLIDNNKNPNMLVIFFAAYQILNIKTGLTPLEFVSSNTFNMKLMGLKESEYEELFDTYHHLKLNVFFDEDLKFFIKKRMGSHIGLAQKSITHIYKRFQSEIINNTLIKTYLTSATFNKDLSENRAFPKIKIIKNLNPIQIRILSSIFKWENISIENSECLNDINTNILNLEQQGFLVSTVMPTSKVYEFASPIIGEIIYNQIFSQNQIIYNQIFSQNRDLFLLLKNPESMSLKDVCVHALQFINGSALRKTQEFIKDGFLKEGQWQDEFYGCLTRILSTEYAISAEAGHELGCKGEIYFYINGKFKWGIELLREGSDLGGHLDRFKKNGIYFKMEKKDYIVIDFRNNQFQKRKEEEDLDHLMRVVYDPNFLGCDIYFHEKFVRSWQWN